jgi:hypothetical protein
MKSEIPSFLDYEMRMKPLRCRNPHLWSIRDLVYRMLAQSAKKRDAWGMGYLAAFSQLLWAAFRNRKFTFTPPKPLPSRASHFIFLNSAPNHFGKLYPLFARCHDNGEVVGWVEDTRVRSKIRVEHWPVLRPVSNLNAWSMRPSDWVKAWVACKQIKGIFPEFAKTRFPPRMYFYILQYYSLRRFWSVVFSSTPIAAYTTFEKGIAAKSMMEAAQMAGCPERVHYLHGLFHPSLTPTFATEMWCMSEREANCANETLPSSCKAKYVVSGESARMREAVGVLDQSSRSQVVTPRILVLGTSTDPTYAMDMRIEDLSAIKAIIQSNPSLLEWRFRPHPGAIDPYRNELRVSDITVDDFSLRSLDDDLRWSHVIITPFSSVGVDAHDLGRIVFWNQAGNRNLFDIDELVSEGVGIRMAPPEFATTLMSFFPKCHGIK